MVFHPVERYWRHRIHPQLARMHVNKRCLELVSLTPKSRLRFLSFGLIELGSIANVTPDESSLHDRSCLIQIFSDYLVSIRTSFLTSFRSLHQICMGFLPHLLLNYCILQHVSWAMLLYQINSHPIYWFTRHSRRVFSSTWPNTV